MDVKIYTFHYCFVQTEFCLLKNSKCFHIDSEVFFILFFIFIASHRVSAFCQHFNSNQDNRVRRYGLVRLTAKSDQKLNNSFTLTVLLDKSAIYIFYRFIIQTQICYYGNVQSGVRLNLE